MTQANKELAQAYFAAVTAGDLPDSLLTSDMTAWTTTQGVMVPRVDCQTRTPASPPDSKRDPNAISRQFFAWIRADPIRSSQT